MRVIIVIAKFSGFAFSKIHYTLANPLVLLTSISYSLLISIAILEFFMFLANPCVDFNNKFIYKLFQLRVLSWHVKNLMSFLPVGYFLCREFSN